MIPGTEYGWLDAADNQGWVDGWVSEGGRVGALVTRQAGMLTLPSVLSVILSGAAAATAVVFARLCVTVVCVCFALKDLSTGAAWPSHADNGACSLVPLCACMAVNFKF